MKNQILSPMQIQEFLRYDAESGILYWKVNRCRARAGDVAGTLRKKYLLVRVNQRSYYVHRIAWAISHGEWPVDEIDHINRNPSDNRLVNLRDVSRAVNLQNRDYGKRGKYKVAGTWVRRSGGEFMGVKQDKRFKNTYIARIQRMGVTRYLGTFRTREEAADAYKAAVLQYENGLAQSAVTP